jgi:hypothetical protein
LEYGGGTGQIGKQADDTLSEVIGLTLALLLLFSVMTLLGDRAWWLPRWLDPIIPDIQLEGSPAPQPQTRESTTVPPAP